MHAKRSLSFLLFSVFICVVIPLLLTEFSMYLWGTDAVSSELTSAAKSNVIYLRDALESELVNSFRQVNYLLEQNSANELFVYRDTLSKAEYYLRVSDIQSLLKLIVYSNSYLDELRLYYTSYNTCISSNSVNAYTEGSDSQMLLDRISKAMKQSQLLSYHDEEEVYLLWSVKPWEHPMYYVEATISKDALTKHLSSFSTYSNKNAMMYCHDTGTYLTSDGFAVDEVISELSNILNRSVSNNEQPTSLYSNDGNYLYVISYSSRLNYSFVQIIPARVLRTIPRRFQAFIISFSLLAVLGAMLFTVILKRIVAKPLHGIMRGFERIGNGDFDTPLVVKDMSSSELYSVAAGYNDMLVHLKKLINENYTMTIQLQRAELKQLQAQINPHFLYNSFFFVRHMVQSDENESALVMLGLLGEYFKYVTRNSQNTETLEEEYTHALNYLSIQSIRFENRVHVHAMPIPEHLTTKAVPRLMLQPIFENTFEYCSISAEHPLEITIEFIPYGNGYFEIVISDNGTGLTDEKIEQLNAKLHSASAISQTTGLINIHKRVVLFFGNDCGLTVSRSLAGGMCVRIKLHEGVYSADV